MTDPVPYEVYAIRYATVERRAAENFIGADDVHETAARMDYFVWVARNDYRTVVIDTGFDEQAAQRRRRQFLRAPVEGLRLMGIDARKVQDVIVTHLHYDHAGNLAHFPSARFHLQDREMAYATGRYMGMPFFSHAYEADDVIAAVRAVYGGRMALMLGSESGKVVPAAPGPESLLLSRESPVKRPSSRPTTFSSSRNSSVVNWFSVMRRLCCSINFLLSPV